MGAVAIGGRAFFERLDWLKLHRHPEARVRLDSNFDRHPEVRVLFTRLEGCTSPVAASFEGRAAMVRHFPEALRLARPPQDDGAGSAVAGKTRITIDF